MLKTILRDAIVYGASTVLTRAVALVIVPIYTRLLSPPEYGAIDILSIFGNLITLTVALEVGQAIARFLPDTDSESERAKLVSTATIFAVVAYSAFTVVALPLSDQLRALLVGEHASSLAVVMAILSIWAIGVFQLVQNVLRFLLRPVPFAVASLLFSLGGLAVGVVLVVGFKAGVAGVFAGQTVGGVLGSLAAVWFAKRLYRPVFSLDALWRMLSFSVPLVPASLGVFVTLYIDRIALAQIKSLDAVGVFGIGYRVASVVSLLLIGFQIAITPIIYMRYKDPTTPGELARGLRMFVAFALLVCMALSIWAPEMVRIITTPEYWGADAVVPLLAPAILLANMYVFMPGLAIAKQTRTIGIITISGAVLNTTLNFALIPLLGVSGAALATLISASVVFLMYVRASQRTYPVPHRWAPFAVAMAGYAVLVAVGVWLEPMTVVATVAKLTLIVALFALVVATGLVRPSELRWFLSRLRQRVSTPR